MKKRTKKKHTVHGKVYLKHYHRHDEALPIAWFELCHKIRNDLGHPIGRKRKSLERYFRRKYYWTAEQRAKFWKLPDHDIKTCDSLTYEVYNTVVNNFASLKEKYEDTKILDYLEEHFGG